MIDYRIGFRGWSNEVFEFVDFLSLSKYGWSAQMYLKRVLLLYIRKATTMYFRMDVSAMSTEANSYFRTCRRSSDMMHINITRNVATILLNMAAVYMVHQSDVSLYSKWLYIQVLCRNEVDTRYNVCTAYPLVFHNPTIRYYLKQLQCYRSIRPINCPFAIAWLVFSGKK